VRVGDLVKIQKWCKNKHRMAIVVRTEPWATNGCWIKYVDMRPSETADGFAVNQNLILISSRDIS